MKKLSRRECGVLLPLLAAKADEPSKHLPTLPGKIYPSTEIPQNGDARKKGGRIFRGATHGGFNLEMHATTLGPGVETHAPHRHKHEEIIVMLEGSLQPTVNGEPQTAADAGSVIYFSSNALHNARNNGGIPCRYYVIELRGDEI